MEFVFSFHSPAGYGSGQRGFRKETADFSISTGILVSLCHISEKVFGAGWRGCQTNVGLFFPYVWVEPTFFF